MTVSVIIPCYNEEKFVGKILDDLCAQKMKPKAVFVVDCHSKDNTVAVAEKYLKKLPLTILRSPYRSAAAARNMGADSSRTDFILLLDADMRIKPNFIKRLVRKARAKNADYVSPRLKIEGYNPIDILTVWCIDLWIGFYRMILKRQPGGVGGAVFIKTSAHKAIGGYNPKLREFDDIDYFKRLQKQHIKFCYDWMNPALTSNRRQKEQGRIVTIIQSVPSDYFLARKVIRPLMNAVGIKPKWHDLDQ